MRRIGPKRRPDQIERRGGRFVWMVKVVISNRLPVTKITAALVPPETVGIVVEDELQIPIHRLPVLPNDSQVAVMAPTGPRKNDRTVRPARRRPLFLIGEIRGCRSGFWKG